MPAGGSLYNLQQLTDALPDHYPITGICIVSEKSNCPPGYKIIEKSYFRQEDADLWKDSFFGRRITRYLCYTRHPSQGQLTHVVGDIALLNEKDDIPVGFTLIDATIDTREKALKKRLLCVKMIPVSDTQDAVTDLLVVNRNNKPPTGFSIVGPANQLTLCYKYGVVPAEIQTAGHLVGRPHANTINLTQDMLGTGNSPMHFNNSTTSNNGLPYPTHPNGAAVLLEPGSGPQRPPVPPRTGAGRERSVTTPTSPHTRMAPHPPPTLSTLGRRQSTLRRQDASSSADIDDPYLALRGIPFEVNPKLTELTRIRNFNMPADVTYLTEEQINEKYSYNFSIEEKTRVK